MMRTSWRPLPLVALFWKRGVVAFLFLSTSVMCVVDCFFSVPSCLAKETDGRQERTERAFDQGAAAYCFFPLLQCWSRRASFGFAMGIPDHCRSWG